MIHVALIYPQFAIVLLIFVSLAYMFWTRVKAVKGGQMPATYFKTYSRGEATEDVILAARHFSNLFEIPVLFFAACLAAMMIPVLGISFEILAWSFVVLRYVHSFIHLGPNKLFWRMRAYGLSVLVVLMMWIHIFWTVVTREM